MSLRALPGRILNRVMPGPGPAGTTHILAYVPGNLSGYAPHPLACDYWELWLARDFGRGYCSAGNDPACLDGPADLHEEELLLFAEETLGRPVVLTSFSVEVDVDGPSSVERVTIPAYYVTPAGGGR